jgi:transcription antitermination factor NusG
MVAESRQEREDASPQQFRFKLRDRVMIVSGGFAGTAGVVVRLPEPATRGRYVVETGLRQAQCAEAELRFRTME